MNNIKHFIHMMYNETINNNKWKEVILLDNKIMYWRKTNYILDVTYNDWSFRCDNYTFVSLSSDKSKIKQIISFLESYTENNKKINWDKIYAFYEDDLFFAEYNKKLKQRFLYNLSEWYGEEYIF